MTWGLKIGVALACLLFIYIQARYQARTFAKQGHISHLGKGLIYFLFVVLLTTIVMIGRWDEWRTYSAWKGIPILGVLTRMAFFDALLNYQRIPRKSFFYNGAGTTGSVLDFLENQLSSTWIKGLKILYLLLFITVLIVL